MMGLFKGANRLAKLSVKAWGQGISSDPRLDWDERLARLEWASPRRWRDLAAVVVIYAVVCGLLVASFEPLSTAAVAYPLAALIWIMHFAIGAALMIAVTTVAVIAGLRMPWPPFLALLLLPPLLAGPSLGIDLLFQVRETGSAPVTGTKRFLSETIEIAPAALAVGAITLLIAARSAILARDLRMALRWRVAREPALRSLLPELPPHLGNDLIRIEAQDHYILVVTTDGQALLTMPFSKAVAKAEALIGTQCHRSHWIRHKHLVSISRRGSAYVGTLRNGQTVPISRRMRAALKS